MSRPYDSFYSNFKKICYILILLKNQFIPYQNFSILSNKYFKNLYQTVFFVKQYWKENQHRVLVFISDTNIPWNFPPPPPHLSVSVLSSSSSPCLALRASNWWESSSTFLNSRQSGGRRPGRADTMPNLNLKVEKKST